MAMTIHANIQPLKSFQLNSLQSRVAFYPRIISATSLSFYCFGNGKSKFQRKIQTLAIAPLRASAGKEGIIQADDDGVSLGTLKLPANTDIARFEILLFQWANSLSQGANLPFPVPLKACEKRKIKLCNVMAAACIIAAHLSKNFEEDQGEVYSVVTLVDCRKYLDPVLDDDDMGFYHSAILNTHYTHGEEGLWEVASRCHNSYSTAMSNKKHLKDIGEINYLMCKAIENPQLTPSSSLRTALISVFDDTKVYNSCDLMHELGVEDYIGCASLHGVGPSIAIFDTIRDGRLDCACVYPAPLHSRTQITDLVEHMKRIMTEDSSKGELATEITEKEA